jgi:GntR family transcriptional repressor for pyruvate dehydrogenase complex
MTRRLHRAVVRAVLEDLAEKRLRPGDALPSEVDLASGHGVSRGVAREAVRALEERGIVVVKHGRGQRIAPEPGWRLLDEYVLHAFVPVGGRTDLLLGAASVRTSIEAEAATALAKAKPSVSAPLRAAYGELAGTLPFRERSRGADDPPVLAEAALHHELLQLAGDPVRSTLLAPLHLPIAAARHTLAPTRDALVLRHHAKLLGAIENADAEAARTAVEAHGRQLARWLQPS